MNADNFKTPTEAWQSYKSTVLKDDLGPDEERLMKLAYVSGMCAGLAVAKNTAKERFWQVTEAMSLL